MLTACLPVHRRGAFPAPGNVRPVTAARVRQRLAHVSGEAILAIWRGGKPGIADRRGASPAYNRNLSGTWPWARVTRGRDDEGEAVR